MLESEKIDLAIFLKGARPSEASGLLYTDSTTISLAACWHPLNGGPADISNTAPPPFWPCGIGPGIPGSCPWSTGRFTSTWDCAPVVLSLPYPRYYPLVILSICSVPTPEPKDVPLDVGETQWLLLAQDREEWNCYKDEHTSNIHRNYS